MVRTFSDGKKIYSVDMILAWINIFKPANEKVLVSDYVDCLQSAGWYDESSKKYISPQQVINNPKKYSAEMQRIKSAELKYPIVIHKDMIIDGVHRLTKSVLENKKYIKAYDLDSKLMRKFLIGTDGNWRRASEININVFIELFYKRFFIESQ